MKDGSYPETDFKPSGGELMGWSQLESFSPVNATRLSIPGAPAAKDSPIPVHLCLGELARSKP
jgi:hypothetical protein